MEKLSVTIKHISHYAIGLLAVVCWLLILSVGQPLTLWENVVGVVFIVLGLLLTLDGATVEKSENRNHPEIHQKNHGLYLPLLWGAGF